MIIDQLYDILVSIIWEYCTDTSNVTCDLFILQSGTNALSSAGTAQPPPILVLPQTYSVLQVSVWYTYKRGTNTSEWTSQILYPTLPLQINLDYDSNEPIYICLVCFRTDISLITNRFFLQLGPMSHLYRWRHCRTLLQLTNRMRENRDEAISTYMIDI